jgi:hypothetical protein
VKLFVPSWLAGGNVGVHYPANRENRFVARDSPVSVMVLDRGAG